MITIDIVRRTFCIRCGERTGTAFTIDRDDREYLITARHVSEGIRPGEKIKIFHENQWKDLSIQIVSMGEGDVDIAILSTPFALSPRFELEPSSGGMAVGQQVYLLGYPFGWNSAAGMELNDEFPVPFVKGGIFSAMISAEETGEATKLYIDAYGNEGFSGGPVVFVPEGKPRNELNVAGIISSYPTPKLAPVVVVDPEGNIKTDQNENIVGIIENPGFVVAISIEHALELIDENPIGFKLPDEGENG